MNKPPTFSDPTRPPHALCHRVYAAPCQHLAAHEGPCGPDESCLQYELLDLIKLMPDAQVDELLSFVATLREARAMAGPSLDR